MKLVVDGLHLHAFDDCGEREPPETHIALVAAALIERQAKEIEALRKELDAQRSFASTCDYRADEWQARAEAAEAKLKIATEGLEAIERFGHGDGHGRGYTCANMAQTTLDAIR